MASDTAITTGAFEAETLTGTNVNELIIGGGGTDSYSTDLKSGGNDILTGVESISFSDISAADRHNVVAFKNGDDLILTYNNAKVSDSNSITAKDFFSDKNALKEDIRSIIPSLNTVTFKNATVDIQNCDFSGNSEYFVTTQTYGDATYTNIFAKTQDTKNNDIYVYLGEVSSAKPNTFDLNYSGWIPPYTETRVKYYSVNTPYKADLAAFSPTKFATGSAAEGYTYTYTKCNGVITGLTEYQNGVKTKDYNFDFKNNNLSLGYTGEYSKSVYSPKDENNNPAMEIDYKYASNGTAEFAQTTTFQPISAAEIVTASGDTIAWSTDVNFLIPQSSTQVGTYKLSGDYKTMTISSPDFKDDIETAINYTIVNGNLCVSSAKTVGDVIAAGGGNSSDTTPLFSFYYNTDGKIAEMQSCDLSGKYFAETFIYDDSPEHLLTERTKVFYDNGAYVRRTVDFGYTSEVETSYIVKEVTSSKWTIGTSLTDILDAKTEINPEDYTITKPYTEYFSSAPTNIIKGDVILSGTGTFGGGTGNDVLYGSAGADKISGGAGADYIDGGDSADYIDGGAGINDLNGGLGNDTYNIYNADDVINDLSNDNNTIHLDAKFVGKGIDLTTYNSPNAFISTIDAQAQKRGLTLTGNADTSTTIYGGSGNDTITGGTASDSLIGGAGNDTYIINSDAKDTITDARGIDTIQLGGNQNELSLTNYENIENVDGSKLTDVKITGNAGTNSLWGGGGQDILDGGADSAKDLLVGGNGGDTYVIHDLKDTITENGTTGSDIIRLANGYDDNAKIAGAAYTLTNANIEEIDGSYSTIGLSLTGKAKASTTITGSDFADIITGGTAVDTLYGEGGDDIYKINNAQDIISDTIGSNTAKLVSSYSESGLNLTEYNNISHLDTIDASAVKRNLILTGNASKATTIIGGSGNDNIIGGSKTDSLAGGKGNDTYTINSMDDIVTEAKNAGTDMLILKEASSYDIDLSSVKYANIENIEASNIASGATLKGSSAVNTIFGGAGSDVLYGGSDSVKDFLSGANGSDNYIIDDLKDIINEFGMNVGDIDTITLSAKYDDNLKTKTTASYTLNNENIEALDGEHSALTGGLTLTGNAKKATSITGGDYNDTITGGAGADVLTGGKGNDILNGGAGVDTFKFSSGDGKDYIKATEAGEQIIINEKGVSTDDLLFYTDKYGNFFIDYSDDAVVGSKGVGTDVIEIAKGYDVSTTVQVGDSSIQINAIVSQLSASTSGLDAAAISGLSAATESDQAKLLTLAWTNGSVT